MKSKIKNIIFITLIAFPFVGFTNKLKLGLHGGVNFSTISASNAPKEFNSAKGFLPGLLIGLSNEVKLNDYILLMTEVNYSSKGYSNNQSGIRVKSYSQYLTIPIKLKTYTQKGLGLEIGPYIGIAVKEYIKNNISKTKVFGSIGNNINIEPPNTLKPLDIGIQSGVSYKINNINFSGIVSFGILNIRPGGGYGSSIRNVSTQIRVSYEILNFE